jgi:hypothetical protein
MAEFGLPANADLQYAETAAPLTREEFEARAYAATSAQPQYQPAPAPPYQPAPAPQYQPPAAQYQPVPAPQYQPPAPQPGIGGTPSRQSAPPPMPSYAPQPLGGSTAGGYQPQSHSSAPPIYGIVQQATAAMPGVDQDPEAVPDRAPRILAGFLVSYDVEPLGRFWPIYQGKNRLGRRGGGTDLDIELDHPTTSSRHAVILAAACPGRLKLEDTGSTNGTLLNGVRVAPGTRPELKDGDRVRLGLLSTIVKVV